MVASAVDFLIGLALAEAAVGLGPGLVFEGTADDALVGEADASAFGFGFGVGEAVFSVVIDTLGSDRLVSALSGTVSSGEGDELTSWAFATGRAAATTAKAKRDIFIGSSCWYQSPQLSPRNAEKPPVWSGRASCSAPELRLRLF